LYIKMRIIPSRSQWRKWSLPSKVGYIASCITIIGVASLIFRPLGNIYQNHLKEIHSLEIARLDINRLIEDCDLSCLKIAKQFPEEVNKIVGSEFGTEGSLIAKLMALPNVYGEKMDSEYEKLIKDEERICLENFNQKDIHLILELKTEAQKIDNLYNRLQKYKESFEQQVQETWLYQNYIANKK